MLRSFTLLFLFTAFTASLLGQSVTANIDWSFASLSGSSPQGVPVNNATLPPGLVVSNITRGNGVTTENGTGEFKASNWQTTSASAARSTGDLFTVTLTPGPGQSLTIGTVLITARRSGGSKGLTNYAIFVNGRMIGAIGSFSDNGNFDYQLDRDVNTTFAPAEAVTIEVVGWGGGNANADFSLRSFSLAGSSLPIILKSFTATPEHQAVNLEWITTEETDNDYFALERSADGRYFETIDRVNGKGSTDTETSYRYTDTRPVSGRSYYRLRQVDFDGTTAYYGPIAVDRTGNGIDPVRVYPNPSQGNGITLDGDLPPGTRVSLLNAAGRVLRNWTIDEKQVRRELPMSGMTPGTYFLRVENGGTVHTVRLVRQ